MEKINNLSLLKEANSSPDAYDVAFDVVKLPSKGLIYDETHPLCGESEVTFKAMTAVEENILATKAYAKKGTTVSVLVKSCLVNKAIDPTTLLLGDKTAIVLALRISGFGSEYRVPTLCPNCKETFVHTFDLSKCQFKFLETNPVSPGKNLFEFVLPKSKKTVHFSLLTDGDDLDISRTQINRKKAMNTDIDTRITDELIKIIRSVDGKDDRDFITKFVLKMSPVDSRALRKYANDIMPDVDWEQEVTCKECGERDLHKILLTSEFFWPTPE
jgi:hypothetical protein